MRSNIADAISTFFLEYETPRQVVVKNRRVGVVCRLIQLIVLVYIIGWVFIYEKGYQVTDKAIGSVYTKMKGVGYTKVNGVQRVWDVDDYVFPEQGDASFVVMTNYIMTMGQQQGNCPELPGKHSCQSDEDCEEGDYRRGGHGKFTTLSPNLQAESSPEEGSPLHGMLTGKCVSETKTCEVSAWCPVENDLVVPDPPLLMAAENFTLFIKNSITFPMFGIVRSNLVKRVNLRTCVFHEDEAPLCPIFRLGDIVRLSGFNFQELAVQGGAIGILIDWTCDFDWDRKHCLPKYNFHGLYGDGELMSNSSVGYNFRSAKYYMDGTTEKRTLTKVFGLRIDVVVQGVARKFDIIPTLTTIGSGVGIFGVATVVCDLVLLYVLPKRDFYKNMKFKYTIIDEEKPVLQMDKPVMDSDKE